TLDIMSGIEVAAYALQILSLFSHLLVVEVSLGSIACQLCREEIFMAMDATGIINVFRGSLKCRCRLPVKICRILCPVAPQVTHSCLRLLNQVTLTLRRKMTFGAAGTVARLSGV